MVTQISNYCSRLKANAWHTSIGTISHSGDENNNSNIMIILTIIKSWAACLLANDIFIYNLAVFSNIMIRMLSPFIIKYTSNFPPVIME